MTSLHRYRCRIGDPCRDGAAGIEKHCTESELGHAKPSPGFELCVGDVVRVARQRDGRVVRVCACAGTLCRPPLIALLIAPAIAPLIAPAIAPAIASDGRPRQVLATPLIAPAIAPDGRPHQVLATIL